MIYMIYLLQLDFNLMAVIGRLVQKKGRERTKEKQCTKQYKNHTRTQNTQSGKQKYATKNKHKRITKE